MTDAHSAPSWSTPTAVSGPSLAFGFNLAKIPDHGEDADPILRDGPDLALAGVLDGMGGAGGTIYETPDGPRTGAYLASRLARDVVETRMLDLLEPDWNLNGTAAAEDLARSVRRALEERLVELKAPPSRLRSRLIRALPTTMALIAVQRTHRDGSTWAGHVFWAGDSRVYAFTAEGAHQLHPDDLRDPGDAMANLHHDSVVSNAMSADTDFEVHYRKVELKAPFLLVCATDGCFGYLPTPMHFEQLVLAPLAEVDDVDAWSQAVQARISEVTGDDAAMAAMGVGADLAGFAELFAPRIAALRDDFIAPLDQSGAAVREAEQALDQARRRLSEETAQLWEAYQTGYEHFLHLPPESSTVQKWWHKSGAEQTRGSVHSAATGSGGLRTPVDGDADGVEEKPLERDTDSAPLDAGAATLEEGTA